MNADIKHVSDTALWVATYRANETKKSNALFSDPLAEKLVGDRGRKIASEMPYSDIMEWVLVMRTLGIDRLVMRAIELGVDTVVNLGAGLDTRPYRMNLPVDLLWVEVDFPHMIDYKNEQLRSDKPACRLERTSVDLSNIDARRAFFSGLGSASKKMLVITEGVLLYLTDDEVALLSQDLLAIPSVQYWIQDYRNQGLDDWAPKRLQNSLKDAPFKFNPENWLDFFVKRGWKTKEYILASEIALREWRPFPSPFPWNILASLVPTEVKKAWSRANGYVLFSRDS